MQMVTIREIAEKSGVSIATVSNIINNRGKASEETEAKVRKVIEEMHYVPNAMARNLKSKRSMSIGTIVEDMTIFSVPDILDGITDYFDHHGYKVLLTNLRLFKNYGDSYYNKDFYYDMVHKEVQKLENLQVEGVIYVASHERKLPVFETDMDIPAVMAYGYSQNEKVPSVVVDDENGMYQITKKVIEAGHKKIGLITGKSDSLHAQARLMGFQKALYESSFPIDPGFIKVGDWERESGFNNTDELLKHGATAIMCMNDIMAGGVYDRLEKKGLRAGQDVSVTGYDDRQLSVYYRPPLTTVALPLHDIGYRAAGILFDMIEGKSKTVQKDGKRVEEVPCTIEIRDSLVDINH